MHRIKKKLNYDKKAEAIFLLSAFKKIPKEHVKMN